jgi:archaellum biogenesis protein FlaJ (TadC family)
MRDNTFASIAIAMNLCITVIVLVQRADFDADSIIVDLVSMLLLNLLCFVADQRVNKKDNNQHQNASKNREEKS